MLQFKSLTEGISLYIGSFRPVMTSLSTHSKGIEILKAYRKKLRQPTRPAQDVKKLPKGLQEPTRPIGWDDGKA